MQGKNNLLIKSKFVKILRAATAAFFYVSLLNGYNKIVFRFFTAWQQPYI